MSEELEVLREAATAKTLGISKALLRAWRRKQKGLPYVQLGRAIGYRRTDIQKFLAANTVLVKQPR